MAPFDAPGLQLRCERWSALLREDGAAEPLHALLGDMEQNSGKLRELAAQRKALLRYHIQLVAEIEKVIGRARAEMFSAKHLLRPMSFSAEDLREESRLCRDEAAATADIEMRRKIAALALDFAMLGEAATRVRHR